MSNQEILDKAIEKAIAGGFPQAGDLLPFELIKNKVGTYLIHSERDGWASVEGLIFNHNFAKALWGEEMFHYKSVQSGEFYDIKGAFIEVNAPAWLVHLVGMTTSADPIQYLGDTI